MDNTLIEDLETRRIWLNALREENDRALSAANDGEIELSKVYIHTFNVYWQCAETNKEKIDSY